MLFVGGIVTEGDVKKKGMLPNTCLYHRRRTRHIVAQHAFEINDGGNVSLFLNHAIVKVARASPKRVLRMERVAPLTNRRDFDLGPASRRTAGFGVLLSDRQGWPGEHVMAVLLCALHPVRLISSMILRSKHYIP